MESEPRPRPPEALVGRDELDEDDEMVLSGDDLVAGEAPSPARSFPFRFTPPYRAAAALFGVTPARAAVTVAGGRLDVRYGPWRLTTGLANVAAVEETGPYGVLRTIGPAHVSLADRGLTFASNPDRGLCIRFAEPVAGIEPTGRVRHPAVTVTVADPAGLRAALRR
jgi:hypothetical protein